MKFTTLSLAAIAAFLPAAMAGSAVVDNHCAVPVYLTDGSVKRVLAAHTGSYTTSLTGAGRSLKLAKSATSKTSLAMEFSVSGSTVYYDLSNNAGNPFDESHNTLVSSNASCGGFNCAPDSPNCYSHSGAIKERTCGTGATLTTTLCA